MRKSCFFFFFLAGCLSSLVDESSLTQIRFGYGSRIERVELLRFSARTVPRKSCLPLSDPTQDLIDHEGYSRSASVTPDAHGVVFARIVEKEGLRVG